MPLSESPHPSILADSDFASRSWQCRPATAADQRAITAIVRDAGINPWGLHWSRFLVVEAGGQIVGVGQVKPHGDGSRELASIAVVPEWQGRGVARLIIEALLAREPGPLYLTCRARLQPFYRRFGFETVGDGAPLPRYFRWVRRAVASYARLARLDAPIAVMYREQNGSRD